MNPKVILNSSFTFPIVSQDYDRDSLYKGMVPKLVIIEYLEKRLNVNANMVGKNGKLILSCVNTLAAVKDMHRTPGSVVINKEIVDYKRWIIKALDLTGYIITQDIGNKIIEIIPRWSISIIYNFINEFLKGVKVWTGEEINIDLQDIETEQTQTFDCCREILYPQSEWHSSPMKMHNDFVRNPRIFHGPENVCGIGRYLADWQRESKGVKSDFIVYADHTPHQNSHVNLHLDEKNPVSAFFAKFLFLIKALNEYDLFHFYFGKSLLPLNLDLPILKIFGKKILMDYLGSDIRLMSIEEKRNPYNHLRSSNNILDRHEWIKKIRMRWHGLWADRLLAARFLYAHALTSIPRKKIISNLWVNNTMDLSVIHPNFVTHKIPVIVHAPTNFKNKGTLFIQKAVDELKGEGKIFEFRVFHKVPHKEVINYIHFESDIVVDQLIGGGFGTLAMEAMSFGKPVCVYVLEEVLAMVPDLPVVQSTIETIKDRLAWLIDHPEERVRLGKAGWEFAKAHYDRDKNCQELWALYLEILNT